MPSPVWGVINCFLEDVVSQDDELATLRRKATTCVKTVTGERCPFWRSVCITGRSRSQPWCSHDRAPLGHISHSRDWEPLCLTWRVLLREQEAHLPSLYAQIPSSNLRTHRLFCSQPKACLTLDSPATSCSPASRGS